VSSKNSNASHNGLCVLTVCADSATIDDVMRATLQVFAAQFVGGLNDYLNRTANLDLLQRAQDSEACLCVIDFDRDRVEAVQTAKSLQQMFGARITMIALSERSDPALILDAMRSGCNEYLVKPVRIEQLSDSLVRLQSRWAGSEKASTLRGGLLAFLGTRGGAGATTLAVHIATFLAKVHQRRVLLVDLHAQLGHVGLYLGFPGSRYDFAELVRNIGRLDSALLSGFVAHHDSGVDVLQSPDVLDVASEAAADDAERALLFLRGLYDYVIFDCQRSFTGANLAVIDHADELYLVATPDVPAVRDLSRCVDRLIQCNISPGKLKVAVNRSSSSGAVSLQQIEKAIRQPVSITIPNCSAELIRAMNTGTPLDPGGKSEFVSQIRKWAASLVPGAAVPEAETPAWSGWRIPFLSSLKVAS
jgi:pilus assembly protein CpaE